MKTKGSQPECLQIPQWSLFPTAKWIGTLFYLAIATRPDIACIICHFIENPSMEHWLATKHILCYLRGTVHMKLVYLHVDSPDLFVTYSDANLSGNPDNSQSTRLYHAQLNGKLPSRLFVQHWVRIYNGFKSQLWDLVDSISLWRAWLQHLASLPSACRQQICYSGHEASRTLVHYEACSLHKPLDSWPGCV